MMKSITPVLAACLLAPLAASAQSLNYNYIQGGGALYPDFDGQDFIGVDVNGSILMTEDVFIFGGMKFLTDDVDLTAVHLGAGYRHALAAETDVYAGVTLEYQEIEATFVDPDTLEETTTASIDDTGIGLRAGLRHMLTDEFEVAAQVRLVTGDLDYFGVTGTAQYFLNRQVGLIGEVDIYDGEMGVIGGVRFNF